NFKAVNYAGGFYDHSLSTAVWSLDGNDELVKTYKELLAMHSVKCRDLKASVRLTTSDVGISGANLYPSLIVDGKNIPLGSPLKLEHKNGATMEDFERKLSMLYSQYYLAIGKLENLIAVRVKNPSNTMKGVMAKIGIPKKYGIPALEKFDAIYGSGFCTAHDIYYAIAEVVFLMQCAGESGVKVTQMEETVSRALNIKWQEFDIPGEMKW
ncbi:MAG: transposase, partial [Clostridia bacterium]|nr:transposase [Clostridia bacterium]